MSKSKVFDFYARWWRKHSERLAAKNHQWRVMDSKRDPNSTLIEWHLGMRLMDLEEAAAPRDWKHPLAWPWMIHWWLEENGVHATRGKIRVFWQRGKRGWSDRDVWGLDKYLSRVIAGSVDHLRETDHGHPSGVTDQQWQDILIAISQGMRAHLRIMDEHLHSGVEYDTAKAEFEAAMDLLKEYWGGLWD